MRSAEFSTVLIWDHSVSKQHCGKCRRQALKRKKNVWYKKKKCWLQFRRIDFDHLFMCECHDAKPLEFVSKPGANITHNATYNHRLIQI